MDVLQITRSNIFKEIRQNSQLSIMNDNKLYFKNNNITATRLLPTIQLLINSIIIIYLMNLTYTI